MVAVRSLALACALFMAGCAFNIISIRQIPTRFVATSESPERWVLDEDLHVDLVEGSASALRKGTVWLRAGHVDQGDVLRTKDQIVTVAASNEYEARPVIEGNMIVGFYLPVEQSFTPADPPAPFKATRQ